MAKTAASLRPGDPQRFLCLLFLSFDDTRIIVMNKRAVGQFSALGQEDRLEIFRLLVRAGPQGNCVEDIKRRLKIPGSTLSHHLDALTRSGLLSAQRSGRFIYYAVNWRETANLIRFLTEDCCADMHTKLTAPTPQTGGGQGACCSKEQPAVYRSVRKDAAVKH
jgi:ArsR family transcriptional regulator, arsenate/arsenite/antimonite-responsive transcriptional repressor